MLEELDQAARDLNVSRQAVIKTLVGLQAVRTGNDAVLGGNALPIEVAGGS